MMKISTKGIKLTKVDCPVGSVATTTEAIAADIKMEDKIMVFLKLWLNRTYARSNFCCQICSLFYFLVRRLCPYTLTNQKIKCLKFVYKSDLA